MPSKTAKLTQAGVARLARPAPGKPWRGYADGEVDGLAVRVMASGVMSYVLRYRAKGTAKTITIGNTKDWPLKEARVEARRLRQLVAQGQDPLATRIAERNAETLRDVVKLWQEERYPHMRPRSIVHDEGLIRLHIDPAFGSDKITDLNEVTIGRWFRKLAANGHQVRANRALQLLGRLCNVAIKHKLIRDNPAKAIATFRESPRVRYLTTAELQRLLAVLNTHPNQQVARLLKLLLVTGARFGEVAGMCWDQLRDLDGANPYWILEADETKQKAHHLRPLNTAAVAILLDLRAARDTGKVVSLKASPWVFPARQGGKAGHVVDVDYAWSRIRQQAQLSNFKLHDLRHSFASFAANAGEELLTVSQLLGHSSVSTTARYAHLFGATTRRATEKIALLINGNGEP